MKKWVLVSLLLLVSFLHAVNITEFVTPYLYTWENYTRDVKILPANLASGNYSIVVINNTYTFLLNLSDRIYFVESQQQIDSILREYYAKTAYPTKAELDALNQSFQMFLLSRGTAELDCRMLTGLAKPDGSPHLTCTKENNCQSCRTVPVCKDYMDHTLTSPDPMSSPLAKAVERMSYDFVIIYGNITLFDNNLANSISGDVSSSLIAIKQSLNAIKTAVEDLGKPPVSKIYEQYAVTHSRDALDFCRNFYKEYNLTALNSALSKATELSNRVPTESALLQQVSSIVASTPERKINRTIREERESFLANYSVWVERRNNLTGTLNLLLPYITDNETAEKLEEVNNILSEMRAFGDERNYSQVNLLSANFSRAADELESHVSSLAALYNELMESNRSASDALFEAWLRVEESDFATRSRLEDLYTQKVSLEFTIQNSSPFTIQETNQLINEFKGIKQNAISIRDEKKAASSQQVNNLVVAVAKPIILISLSLLEPIVPLSYEEKERNATTLIAIALAVADLIIFLISLGAFFYVIRSRRIILPRVAKILWSFIFAFFALLLILGSLAVYNVADMQSHPTTYDVFLSELKESTKAGVVAELTGLNGSMRDAVSNCSEKLAEKLTSIGKTVMHYKFDGQDCLAANETTSRAACENSIDANPVIILRSGENKAVYQVLYTKKATLEGDEKFFNECIIARVIG
ncbi:MAG: hypothetical protein QXF56_04050 [Candidatus Micrarchaeia archaeon]